MTEQLFCPFCGAPQVAGAQFCFKCGRGLAGAPPAQSAALAGPVSSVQPPSAAAPTAASPAWSQPPVAPQSAPPAWSVPQSPYQPGPGQPGPYGAPTPPGYSAAGQPHAGVSRPMGITILAILEVVGGVLGLLAAKVLFDYADALKIVSNYYGQGDSGGTYQLVGLLSAAGAIAAFALAYGLWSIRPWAWLVGWVLSAATISLALLSLVNHGDAASAAINIGVSAAVLYYLNLNEIRALFGRPPGTYLQNRP